MQLPSVGEFLQVSAFETPTAYPQRYLQRCAPSAPILDFMANIPLQFPPKTGDIVMCDFPACLQAPEMIKTRAVVVISRRAQHQQGLAIVVPLSSTVPSPILDHHCEIPARLLPKFMQASGGARWIKGNMVYTLSVKRLSLPAQRDRRTGKRVCDLAKLDLEHLQQVRQCVASATGITADIFQKKQTVTVTETVTTDITIEVKTA